MEEKDLFFFAKFDDGNKIFSTIFRKSKKDIVLEDEDDFIDMTIDDLMENHNLCEDDARTYARMIYDIWEECGCSLTSFDRNMNKYKKQIFS